MYDDTWDILKRIILVGGAKACWTLSDMFFDLENTRTPSLNSMHVVEAMPSPESYVDINFQYCNKH